MLTGCFDSHANWKTQLYEHVLAEVGFNNARSTTTTLTHLRFTCIDHPDLPEGQSFSEDQQQKVTVLFCGRLFNRETLSREYSIMTCSSDAEFIQHLYIQKGLSFLHALNGSFALVVHDQKNEHLIFCKDQLGTVPLSIATKDGTIYFSNDTHGLSKALFADEPIQQEFIVSKCFDFEANYHFTPHPNVRKVLPGHYLVISHDELRSVQYWFPELIKEDPSISFLDAVDTAEKLVKSAVTLRYDDRFRAAAHMSGGLDSTLVAALAKPHFSNQEPFYALSWSPEETDSSDLPYDERTMIGRQCERLQIKPLFSNPSLADYNESVRAWKAPSEYFFESTVQRNAKQKGINLIFSGWGGDEFLGLRDEALVYESFKRMDLKSLNSLLRGKSLKIKFSEFVNGALFPRRRKPYFKYKIHPAFFQYFKKDIMDNALSEEQHAWYVSKRSFQLGLINYHHLAQRCEDWYLSGQRNGIEYRYPLMDVKLVEFALTLPYKILVGTRLDRPILRAVCSRYLTEEIYQLDKQIDPVAMKGASCIQIEALTKYADELPAFKKNKYLTFIDFQKLERTVDRLRSEQKEFDRGVMQAIYTMKSIDEYTRSYHN